jgi:ribosomal protein S18 acetylase RimI-like enzyme
MHTIRIQPAVLADISTISNLAEEIWRKHYPSIIGVQQVEYMLSTLYSGTLLDRQIREGTQQYFLLFQEGNAAPVGFISVETRNDNSGFIHKFYILQTFQRNGIGSGAFQALLNQFSTVSEFRLQVNRQNIQAINFYFKLGFKIEKVADFDIGHGYFMNDFIMIWNH